MKNFMLTNPLVVYGLWILGVMCLTVLFGWLAWGWADDEIAHLEDQAGYEPTTRREP